MSLATFYQYDRIIKRERQGDGMDAEQAMIDRLRSGDGSALRWLMERYGNDIVRTASLLLKDRHLAEDVSQEVFIDAFRKINQLRQDGSLRGWLLAMTINRCRARMRLSSWKQLLFRDKLEDTPEAHPLGCPGSNEWVSAASLQEAIMLLPLHYREPIVLYYYQELTVSQIADTLGEPEGTVKSKLSRARKLLKISLEEGGWRDEEAAGRRSHS